MNKLIHLVARWLDPRTVSESKALVPTHRPEVELVRERPRARPVYGPDRIGIVGFHDRGFVIARPAMPFAPWLVERTQTLHTRLGGLTNMSDGLQQALDLFETVPPGVFRRIWLLSDGDPNVDAESLFLVVQACAEAHININTIGFGNRFNESLLRDIAAATHRGRFVPVQSLRELSLALAGTAGQQPGRPHRSETTVLAIDCSYSMQEPMEGRPKIEVVQEAILHLIHFKRRLFS